MSRTNDAVGIAHATYESGFVADNDLKLTKAPAAKTGMLIRKPVAEVFEAFIEPDITTKFWFTKSSGRLEVGKQVKWEWEKYGHSLNEHPN
jgi:uncharacterized protein YndB with AHSA1/START domain